MRCAGGQGEGVEVGEGDAEVLRLVVLELGGGGGWRSEERRGGRRGREIVPGRRHKAPWRRSRTRRLQNRG